MGDLPKDRVLPSRPFVRTGVDFCGSFYVRMEIRGKPPQKACKLHGILTNPEAKHSLQGFCTSRKINFKFIPPRAPHFGGLWEAAVKSAEELFFRTVASTPLTYEELTTITVEIEAVLNSRPLTPISEDPNDLAALTPGHLLIGEPINAIIDPYSQLNSAPLLAKWKELTKLKQQFWQQWSKEYLSQLQQGYKWKTACEDVQPGMMVILKEDNTPSFNWVLGRIINPIKGKDGRVHVAEVKTASGIFKRPVHRLAPLPIQNESERNTSLSNISEQLGERMPMEEETSSSEPTAAKRPCKTSLLLTALLIFCCVCPSRATPIYNMTASPFTEVTLFSTQPGIYFENAGTAALITDEWNLVVYYDLEPIWKEYTAIMSGIQQLNSLCAKIHDKRLCQETVEHFQATATELDNSNNLLRPDTGHRVKRAPLDIIGNIANSLFGVLDSEYAKGLSEVISQLNTNDQHLLTLIRNQTSIINSTANLIQRSREITTKQLQQVYSYLHLITDAVNNISTTLDRQKLFEMFNSLSIRLLLATLNFQQTQSSIINVLTDLQHGKVNPMLITPVQLRDQINMIKENLPPHLRPPVDQHHLLALYGIMTIQGRIISNHVLFRIKIPLLSDSVYELWSVTPVPIMNNGKFAVIDQTSKYLLVNLHRDQYYALDDQELRTACTMIRHFYHICKPNLSKTNPASRKITCAVDILLHKPTLANCRYHTPTDVPRWTQLMHPNQWLYTTRDEIVVNVICNHQLAQQHLKRTGIITIPWGCAVKDEDTTLESSQLLTNTVTSAVLPTQNISEILVKSHPSPQLQHLQGDNKTIFHSVQQLQEQISTLQSQTSLPQSNVTNHDVHQNGISYTCLSIILVGLGYAILRQRCSHAHRSTSLPKPAPRRHRPFLQSHQSSPPSPDFMVHIED